MAIEYRLSSGAWTETGDRENFFVQMAAEYHAQPTKTIYGRLAHGEEIRYRADDWYPYLRDGEIAAQRVAARKERLNSDPKAYPQGRELACGCMVYHQTQVMSSSRGSSCADCYDRMSD